MLSKLWIKIVSIVLAVGAITAYIVKRLVDVANIARYKDLKRQIKVNDKLDKEQEKTINDIKSKPIEDSVNDAFFKPK